MSLMSFHVDSISMRSCRRMRYTESGSCVCDSPKSSKKIVEVELMNRRFVIITCGLITELKQPERSSFSVDLMEVRVRPEVTPC